MVRACARPPCTVSGHRFVQRTAYKQALAIQCLHPPALFPCYETVLLYPYSSQEKMMIFQSHPSDFNLPRHSTHVPNVTVSPPDPRVEAIFAILAQSQGFQLYGRPDVEDLTRLFKTLLEARRDGSTEGRALSTLFGNCPTDWERHLGTNFVMVSDATANTICQILNDNGVLRDARLRVKEALSPQATLHIPATNVSP
ncbi:hypothetical protein PENSPDRAFT_649914 [Peniophora sp. CONT]|nr:hypothetical protein PENSPDRAFT_649914 [Peniophora sp. CONT]